MRLDQDTQPPDSRRARAGKDWGARVARVLCGAFFVIGVLPLALVVVVRSVRVQAWAARETERLLRAKAIVASYRVRPTLWPAGLRIEDLRVDSTDGGAPALVASTVTLRPRIFALLSGKLAIAEVAITSPTVRLVVRGRALLNLGLRLPESTGRPFHAPFDVVSIDGGRADVELDGMRVRGVDLDVDVTAFDDPDVGSAFDIAVRAGETLLQQRVVDPPRVDDDVLCSVDARLRLEPGHVLVRRLEAVGYVDLDAKADTPPGCSLGLADARRAEVSLSHFAVDLPRADEPPSLAGYLHVRVPVGAAQRLASLPETDGWIAIAGDIRYRAGMRLPEARVHFEAHAIQLGKFRFAQEIQSDLSVVDDVIASSATTVRIADGTATLSSVEVRPLEAGIPLRARLDVVGASFTTLMANLGVSPQAHVAWDIQELHAPDIVGTLVPLHIDGDFTAPTANFAVFDRPAKDPSRERIIGVRDAGLRARFAVRPWALEFQNVHVAMPHSTLSDGFVSIGYHGALRVDAPVGKIDLADATPLAAIPLAGEVDLDLHIDGNLGAPHLWADARIQRFALADMPFGNITQAHADLNGVVLDLRDVRATRGKGSYELPSARLDFRGPAALAMDAVVRTSGLGLRELLGVFRMDDDPRFAELDGQVAATADMHLALGGPEDACGGGFLVVHTKAHAERLNVFGETFDDGDADLTFRWVDRLAGLAGADVDLRGVTLHKVRGVGPAAQRGAVIGSGSLRRGSLRGQATFNALPVSRLDVVGPRIAKAEGTLSGVVSAAGTVDAWAARGALDASPVRFRGATFGSSAFTFEMTQQPGAAVPHAQRTRCGAPVPPAFDKDAYLADTSSAGTFGLSGDFFGGQVLVRHFLMTRQKASRISGDVTLNRLSVGALEQAFDPSAPEETATPLDGEASGDLHIDHLDLGDLAASRLTFRPGSMSLSRGTARVSLRTTGATVAVLGEDLTVPEVVLSLEVPHGGGGSATVSGNIHRIFHDPEFDLRGNLAPVDLALVAGMIPRVERAGGMVGGSVSVSGRSTHPLLSGALHLKGGEVAVRGLPGALTDIDVDVIADSNELRIAHGTARFAGGLVRASGSAPITKDGLGRARVDVQATDIHLAPADGVTATFDAALQATTSLGGGGEDALPHLTGDITVTSFEYSRPVNLDLNAFGGRSRKTSAPTYDPGRDSVRLEVAIRSRSPFLVRNNLVEGSLRIDSGALMVSGTNQLFGLRGALKVEPGARFHILANDFDIKQGEIRFDDPTRVAANVDVLAVTEYRRYTDTTTAAAAGAGAGPEGIASQGAGNIWRISLHAYGDVDDLHLDMTSDPPLSHEDIVLLLTIGMTGAEVAQVQAGSLGTSAALEALATASGADRAVKNAIPLIDDFRFGSAYSSKTGRTEPQVIVGKHLADAVRASVATSVGQDQELRATVEWRLSQRVGVQGSYDNINDVSSSTVGNVGVDLRWHIEFE